MTIFKVFLFKLLKGLYLLPSKLIYFIQFFKSLKKKNYQNYYLLGNENKITSVLHEVKEFYFKKKKKDLRNIIENNLSKKIYSVDVNNLLSEELQNQIIRVLSDKQFVDELSIFFGSKMKFNSFMFKLNFFNPNTKENEGPKMWHRDNDSFFGQIKVFIVLNELTRDDGGLFYFIPQNYIKDYQKIENETIDSNLSLSDQKSRINNSTIKKLELLNKETIEFGLKNMQYLALDTNETYHKGGYIKNPNARRLLLQIIYEPIFNPFSNYNKTCNKNIILKNVKILLTGLKNRLRVSY